MTTQPLPVGVDVDDSRTWSHREGGNLAGMPGPDYITLTGPGAARTTAAWFSRGTGIRFAVGFTDDPTVKDPETFTAFASIADVRLHRITPTTMALFVLVHRTPGGALLSGLTQAGQVSLSEAIAAAATALTSNP